MAIQANKNRLEGLTCPECGHEDCFVIETTCRIEFVGGEINPDYPHTFDWDKDSGCQCSSCGYESDVEAFSESEEETLKKKFWRNMHASGKGYGDHLEMLLEKLTVEQLREACADAEIEDDE